MFEVKDKVENIVGNIEDIAKTYYKLSVVRAADKGSKLAASLLVTLLIFALLFFILLFAGLGLSWWIGQKLSNQMLGYLIVAGGLFVLLISIVLLKGKLIQPIIRNIIINKIYG